MNLCPALQSVRFSLTSLPDEAGNTCDPPDYFGVPTIGEPHRCNSTVWMRDKRDVILCERAVATQVTSVAKKQEIEGALAKFCS